MAAILIFIGKSMLISAVLLLYYGIVLRSRKMPLFNRFYLLGTVVCSLVIPLLHFDLGLPAAVPGSADFAVRAIEYFGPGDETDEPVAGARLSLAGVSTVIYVLVSIALLADTLIRIAGIYRLKRRYPVVRNNGWDMVYTRLPQAPFSFMKTLFWNDALDPESDAGRRILDHERCHMQQFHSLDKLFMQLVIVVCWTNPVYWLIRYELAQQHEFLADAAAIAPDDTDAFARMLLAKQHPAFQFSLTQSFFHSPVQRRLFMISQTSNIPFRSLRMLLTLPIVGVLLAFNSFDNNSAPVVKAKHNVVLVLDAGHGGADAGATDGNGLEEKTLTLAVADKIAGLAPEYNVEVVRTRHRDETRSLQERINGAAAVNAGVFISIHINKSAGHTMANPYEVIVCGKNKELASSKALATAVIQQLEAMGMNIPLADRSLKVLRENKLPAIAIECGDINDPQQMAVLTDDARLTDFCRNILSGIVQHDNYLHKHQ